MTLTSKPCSGCSTEYLKRMRPSTCNFCSTRSLGSRSPLITLSASDINWAACALVCHSGNERLQNSHRARWSPIAGSFGVSSVFPRRMLDRKTIRPTFGSMHLLLSAFISRHLKCLFESLSQGAIRKSNLYHFPALFNQLGLEFLIDDRNSPDCKGLHAFGFCGSECTLVNAQK